METDPNEDEIAEAAHEARLERERRAHRLAHPHPWDPEYRDAKELA